MTKNKKEKVHVTYNKKDFLAPDSIRSMAAIHCKIKKCGEGSVVISDCRNSIKLWNNLSSREEKKEMILKIHNLRDVLLDFQTEIQSRL